MTGFQSGDRRRLDNVETWVVAIARAQVLSIGLLAFLTIRGCW
jgi:hypothetical protein